MISFKSKYILPANYLYKNSAGNWQEKTGSLVELNPDSICDCQTFDEIGYNWGSIENIENFIREDFIKSYKNEIKPFRFFALTAQTKDYDFIESQNVLSIAEVSNFYNRSLSLDLLQTAPAFSNYNKDRIIKNSGKSIIESLSKIFNLPITVFPLNSAVQFYKKIGFKEHGPNGEMILRKII